MWSNPFNFCFHFTFSSPDDDDQFGYYYDEEYEYEEDYETSDDPVLVVKDHFVNKRCSDFSADGFRSVFN